MSNVPPQPDRYAILINKIDALQLAVAEQKAAHDRDIKKLQTQIANSKNDLAKLIGQ